MSVANNKRRHLFSVFVGHLAKDVTKTDLFKLFSECGEPYDIYVSDNEDSSPYKYGFIRYTNPESCMKAVHELNQWSFHGNLLIVDLAKDTKGRIKRDGESSQNKDNLCSVRETPSPRNCANFSDLMRLGHLKETFIEEVAQMKTESQAQGTKLTQLLDDICETKSGFANTFEGQLIDDDVDLKHIGQKLLSDGHNINNNGASARDFFSALGDIMTTINSLVVSGKDNLDSAVTSAAPSEESRCVLPDSRATATSEDSKVNKRHMSGSISKDTSDRHSSDFLSSVDSKFHIPAAPTLSSSVTDSSAVSKLKRKDISDDDCFPMRRLNDTCGVKPPKTDTVASQSCLCNDSSVHRHVLNRSSVTKQTTDSLITSQLNEPHKSSNSGKVLSGLKDAHSMMSSPRYFPAGYETTNGDCVNSDSSESDCQNGDSGVDTDSLQSSLRQEGNNCNFSLTGSRGVQLTPQHTASPSSAELSSPAEQSISAIELYLKTVSIGRGKRRSLGYPT
ncbi:uncharacterized protein LOC121375445 [Gigantopelta aegis]|uniref:uncharacterized protein LOC121375445 n=1 Tax=Gigantopelta aegis TaxID=1735272 RepID=UPI001B88B97A|nr:uncharacterized protein LOC121375445 [Gigantopelta aegis]XP_041358840.1 uncharacterized protein LOC121375445 [Gigantopelta aegis]XP_041358841.1 uncharacterized protein LOC121375445 [Gigantopelta aegis]